jgi:septal ring factor EnvC (AmiA/AmiB activator)
MMELSRETLDSIGDYVKANLAAWFREVVPPAAVHTDPVMLERVVKVEESIERQQALMRQGFDNMEKRFEQIDKRFEQIDKRFEQIDKRLDQVDKRFDQVDKRFEELRYDMNARFADLQQSIRRGGTIATIMLSALLLLVGYGTFLG